MATRRWRAELLTAGLDGREEQHLRPMAWLIRGLPPGRRVLGLKARPGASRQGRAVAVARTRGAVDRSARVSNSASRDELSRRAARLDPRVLPAARRPQKPRSRTEERWNAIGRVGILPAPRGDHGHHGLLERVSEAGLSGAGAHRAIHGGRPRPSEAARCWFRSTFAGAVRSSSGPARRAELSAFGQGRDAAAQSVLALRSSADRRCSASSDISGFAASAAAGGRFDFAPGVAYQKVTAE